MMTDIRKLTDPYERKARLYPALLCMLPIIVSVSVSFPDIYTMLSGLVALAVAFGGLHLLSNLARDRGKNLESKLFEAWGGMPSVSIFRHSDPLIPAPAKLKYHQFLSDKTGIPAPPLESEVNDSFSADEVYRAWSDYLRSQGRNTVEFPLLFKENINYGFRRNLLGIRWHCILSSLLAVGLVIAPKFPVFEITEVELTIIVLNAFYLLVLAFVVKRTWVKVMAVEYAKRLVEVIESLRT
ncbi:MAG: hypothetical protein RPU12_09150 [Candidatus Sedimenticola sp. (ex Thyasira tokunagai)]